MKKIRVISIILASLLSGAMLLAQNNLSLETYLLVKKYQAAKELQDKQKLKSEYRLLGNDESPQVKVFIAYNADFDKSELEQLGGKIGVETSKVLIATIPIDKLMQLSDLKGVMRVDIGGKVKPMLDKAIPAMNVDAVHKGQGLSQPYTGKGVIVGIIDIGFDFTHPMFSDANGNCRVKRAWLANDNSGNPPNGYDFGTLYTDANYIKNVLKYSNTQDTHGSHTLGIAAGRNESDKYSGIATEADIVVVELLNTFDEAEVYTQLIESVDYMYKYADSVGKPIVINMSLGLHQTNAHDGTEIGDIALQEIMQNNPNGKIIVASAGNSGGMNIHYSANVKGSIITTGHNLYMGYILGMPDEEFKVEISVYTKNNPNAIAKTLKYSTNQKRIIDTTIYDATKQYSYPLLIELDPAYQFNNKPYCKFELNPFKINAESYYYLDMLGFTVTSTNANIHAWGDVSLTQTGSPQIADSKYTVASPAIIDEVIAVGAYITKTEFVNYQNTTISAYSSNNIEDITDFSSIGPATDGRIKPDITAPGSIIISACNNAYVDNLTISDLYLVGPSATGGWYIAKEGTSMSCPMVTGVVALMLEVNPKLTSKEIKQILQATAINDNFTGNVRNNKSAYWGWGKVNALAAMVSAETSGIYEGKNDISDKLTIYPNPVINNNVTLQFDNPIGMPYAVQIYDAIGKLVFLSSITDDKTLDISHLSSGTYTVILINGNNIASQKIAVAR